VRPNCCACFAPPCTWSTSTWTARAARGPRIARPCRQAEPAEFAPGALW